MDAEERKKKISERNKRLRERELNDINKILAIPEGRRFARRIMDLAGTFGVAPTDGRSVGLTLFADIMQVKPEAFLQMQREYRSEQESFRREIPPEPDEL